MQAKYFEENKNLVDEYLYYAKKLGLQAKECFDWIVVYNGYDVFKFKATNGKIRLLHRSNRFYGKEVYHEQFRRYISPMDLMTYIKEHGMAKVSGKWVNFSIAA